MAKLHPLPRKTIQPSGELSGNGVEYVPLGFAEWVKAIDEVLPGLAPRVNALLLANEPFEAVGIYELTGNDFNAWMQIMKSRNTEIFQAINELLAAQKIERALKNYRLFTQECLGETYH